LRLSSDGCSLWLFDSLLQLVFHTGEKDVEQTTPHGEQARQFTRDDCSRIAACTVNAVLEKLAIRQIVEGIAVFPAGEGVLLVDVVMRDLHADDTWGVTVTIPPP